MFCDAGAVKTFPACEVATELANLHGGHAIYITPTRLVWDFALKHARIRPDVLDVQRVVLNGTAEERRRQIAYFEMFSKVTTMHLFVGYDAVRIHQQWFQGLENIIVLVADEAHLLKNPHSQRTRAVKSINARYRIAMTGNPITNRPDDLWSILHFLDPGPEYLRRTPAKPPTPGAGCPHSKGYKNYYRHVGCNFCPNWDHDRDLQGLPARKCCRANAAKDGEPSRVIRYRYASPTWGSYDDFVKRYCLRRWDGYGYKIAGVNPRRADELHRLLKAHGMHRVLLDEVADLPPLVFQHVRLEPTPAERRNYKLVENGIITLLENAETGAVSFFEKLNPLAILTYLRQATVLTPPAFAALRGGLLDEIMNGQGGLVKDDKSSKEEWLLEHMKETNGAKYLVYCHWIGACDHLVNTLRKNGMGVIGIYGNNKPKSREIPELVRRFREDPKLRVIVGNESMEVGLDFQEARYVVFMHLDWLPKTTQQSIARARRIGQTRTAVAHFLSHRGTIDEAMAEQAMAKQADADSILDPDFVGRSGLFNISTAHGLLNLIRRET